MATTEVLSPTSAASASAAATTLAAEPPTATTTKTTTATITAATPTSNGAAAAAANTGLAQRQRPRSQRPRSRPRPATITLRARDGDSLTDARRFALQTVAVALVAGCAVLTLSMRAVPRAQLCAVLAAVVYAQTASLLLPAERAGRRAPAGRIQPLAADGALSRGTVRALLLTSTLLSLLLPWMWLCVAGATRAQQHMLAPHLFVMMTQVLFEIWSYRNKVNVVIRIGVPVAFVSYRLHVLRAWVEAAAARVLPRVADAGFADRAMLALAVANLAFWAVMLLYVLLLKVCPPYFVRRDDAVDAGELDAEPRTRPVSAPAR